MGEIFLRTALRAQCLLSRLCQRFWARSPAPTPCSGSGLLTSLWPPFSFPPCSLGWICFSDLTCSVSAGPPSFVGLGCGSTRGIVGPGEGPCSCRARERTWVQTQVVCRGCCSACTAFRLTPLCSLLPVFLLYLFNVRWDWGWRGRLNLLYCLERELTSNRFL